MSDLVIQVQRHLADIPELYDEARHYLIPGSAPLDPTFKSSGKGSVFKIPITAEIFDLLSISDKELDDVGLNRSGGERRLGVLPTLGLWVALAYAELDDLGRGPRECCPARAHTVAGEATWLSEYTPDVIELHDDFAREVELLWVELRRACRVRRDYVPKCPQCAHRVEGVYGSPEDQAPAWWRCTGCPKTWVHDAEIARLAATQPRLSLRQAASVLQIPVSTLHRWKNQGRFSPDSKGRYELDHIKRAAIRVAVPA